MYGIKVFSAIAWTLSLVRMLTGRAIRRLAVIVQLHHNNDIVYNATSFQGSIKGNNTSAKN